MVITRNDHTTLKSEVPIIHWNQQGPTGFTGAAGARGSAGAAGPIGPTGIQGLRGLKGETGDVGIQGTKGDPGIQGVKGDTGSVGPQGQTGSGFQQTYSWTGSTTKASVLLSAYFCSTIGGSRCPDFYVSQPLPNLSGDYEFSPHSTVCFTWNRLVDLSWTTTPSGGIWLWDGTTLTSLARVNPNTTSQDLNQTSCFDGTSFPSGVKLEAGDVLVQGGRIVKNFDNSLVGQLTIRQNLDLISVPPSTSID